MVSYYSLFLALEIVWKSFGCELQVPFSRKHKNLVKC